jgi:hypothetical protein
LNFFQDVKAAPVFKLVEDYTFVHLKKTFRFLSAWPHNFVFRFSPVEWLAVLTLLRVTPDNHKEVLPQRFWDILSSLLVPGSPQAGPDERLITMCHQVGNKFNLACQNTLPDPKLEFTCWVEIAQGATRPAQPVLQAFLKKRALGAKLTVCAGTLIVLKRQDSAGAVMKMTEARVHASVSLAFQDQKKSELPLLLGDGQLYILKPSKLQVAPGVFLHVYEAVIGYAQTAHMAQSQQKFQWGVSLERKYGADQTFTFVNAQVCKLVCC